MAEEVVMVVVLGMFIVSGAVLMIATMNNRRRLREMAHRERLAMIERGLIPSPEADPVRFEAATGLAAPRGGDRAGRFRTAGVTLIGIGLGLMVLITFAGGSAGVGIGIGGAWAILGAAALLNYFLMTRETDEYAAARWVPPAAPPRSEPPNNIAP